LWPFDSKSKVALTKERMAQIGNIQRGLRAWHPRRAAEPPPGTDRQYYDGYLYEQTDTVGSEAAGFYRYDGVEFTWRLVAPKNSLYDPTEEV
jgi:hypothetical protein